MALLRGFLACPLVALGPALWGLLQLALGCAVVARVLHDLALSGDEEHLESHSHINPRLLPGERQRLGGHLGTRETPLPAVRLFGDRDGLGSPFAGAGPAHGEAPDLGEDQTAILQPSAVAIRFGGVGEVADPPMKSRYAGLLAIGDTTV